MTLMTNDLNDHFFGERGKGETQNRRRKGKRLRGCISPAGPLLNRGGPAMESQGTGTRGDRREKRERRERS